MAEQVSEGMSRQMEELLDNEEMSQQLFDVLGKLYRGQHMGCVISEECANNQAEDERKGYISLTIRGDEKSVKLMLPADDNEIKRKEMLVDSSLITYECSGCVIPELQPLINQDIGQAKRIAYLLKRLDEEGELMKYKAILEVIKCDFLRDAIGLTELLDQFDFYQVNDKRDYTLKRMIEEGLVTEEDVISYKNENKNDNEITCLLYTSRCV